MSGLSGATAGTGGAGSHAELPVLSCQRGPWCWALHSAQPPPAAPAAGHACRAGEHLWHLQCGGEEGRLSETHRPLLQPASSDQARHPHRHTAAQFAQTPIPHPKIITSIMAVFSHLTSIAPNAPQLNPHKLAQFPLPSFPLPCVPAQLPFCLLAQLQSSPVSP